jgi:hypothetical protein
MWSGQAVVCMWLGGCGGYWYEGRGYVGRGVAVHPYYITVHPYLFCGIKVKK